jgi:hypothetical protein
LRDEEVVRVMRGLRWIEKVVRGSTDRGKG